MLVLAVAVADLAGDRSSPLKGMARWEVVVDNMGLEEGIGFDKDTLEEDHLAVAGLVVRVALVQN